VVSFLSGTLRFARALPLLVYPEFFSFLKNLSIVSTTYMPAINSLFLRQQLLEDEDVGPYRTVKEGESHVKYGPFQVVMHCRPRVLYPIRMLLYSLAKETLHHSVDYKRICPIPRAPSHDTRPGVLAFHLCSRHGLSGRTFSKPVADLPAVWRSRFGDSAARRYAATFLGGFLILFASRLAGCCTLGLFISGSTQLAWSGLYFGILIFGFAMLTARLIFGWGLCGYWLRHTAKARFTYDMGGRVSPDSPLHHRLAPGSLHE
jgi:hypothetical protein